jgi:hypothetical protein
LSYGEHTAARGEGVVAALIGDAYTCRKRMCYKKEGKREVVIDSIISTKESSWKL